MDVGFTANRQTRKRKYKTSRYSVQTVNNNALIIYSDFSPEFRIKLGCH